MRSFSVYKSLNDEFVIFISTRFASLRTDIIGELYDLPDIKCSELVYKYHGYINSNDSISFSFNEDAEIFISDVLIPYEIAFSLNNN